MTTYAPISELEAVNLMLEVIGEQPVNSIESGVSLANQAQRLLHETSREVQTIGLNCNTESEYQLSLDGDSKVPVASNVLKVDPSDCTLDVTQRGGFLYDRYNHTFVFTEAPKVEITFFLPYDQITAAARYLIAVRAARRFQERFVGDPDSHRFSEDDETAARTELMRSEMRETDQTMNYNYSVYQALNRRR